MMLKKAALAEKVPQIQMFLLPQENLNPCGKKDAYSATWQIETYGGVGAGRG